MSESTGRRRPLRIDMGDLRVGDIWNSNNVHRDDDESQGAVCEKVEQRGGGMVTVTWRMVATDEVFTETRPGSMGIHLMRRAASVPPREVLWNELDLDLRLRPISREEFEAYMDAYDRAAGAGPVRAGEEPTT